MTTEVIFTLGVAAGLLQLLGYVIYIRNEDIDPNPVTWFMFAYGTAILTVLEWDSHATIAELILPVVCAVLAVYVSWKCWIKARTKDPNKWWPEDWWPEDKWDKYSFISDIAITFGYFISWVLATWAILTPGYREIAVLGFLILSNLSTFPSFYPLLRETHVHPHKEHWLPWTIWALAYAVLGVVTYATHGQLWHVLMFYPISNAVLHGLAGWLARPSAKRRKEIEGPAYL